MQIYATIEDYKKYGEGLIDEAKQEKYLLDASTQIDTLTFNRIYGNYISERQKTLIMMATVKQADFLYQNKEVLKAMFSSFSAGKVSMTIDKDKMIKEGKVYTTNEVSSLLSNSGLSCLNFYG